MYIFQPERFLLEQQIKKIASRIHGRVLDVGAGRLSRYKKLFRYDEYITMDLAPHENISIVGNADAIPFGDGSLDSVVCTQVIGDVPDVRKVFSEFRRVLKPEGVVVLTESFINELHDEPHDYWRFTKFGLSLLCKEYDLEIISLDQRGGFFSVRAQESIRYCIDRFHLYHHTWARLISPLFSLYGHFMIWLDDIDRSSANRKHALGWCVVAKKRI